MQRFATRGAVLWCGILMGPVHANTANAELMSGDVVIIGLNSDNPDEFAWAPLTDLSAGQQLYFSDAGWIAGQFSGGSGDGAIRLTVPAGGLAAGAIQLVEPTNLSAPYELVSDEHVGQGFSLSPSGDQLSAFTGSTAAPLFLFAVHTRASEWGAPAGASANLDSDLYPGLQDGVTAVSLGSGPEPGDEYDNARYVGPTIGSADELLSAVANESLWEGAFASGNDRFADLANGSAGFQVQSSSAPEPSSWALSCLAAAAFRWFRRRRSRPPHKTFFRWFRSPLPLAARLQASRRLCLAVGTAKGRGAAT